MNGSRERGFTVFSSPQHTSYPNSEKERVLGVSSVNTKCPFPFPPFPHLPHLAGEAYFGVVV